MKPPAVNSPVTAALVSVGGSPAPILHVLRQNLPAHVWYFCSAGSRANADDIHAQLDWHPQARFIEVERFEELGPCYRELRGKIPEILAETRIPPNEVLVDYTGGTKTMSAALVLAASELFQQFSYVGGTQREKGGLGVTMDGKERVHYQGNPWSELAIREVERARDLWAGYQFEVAACVLREAAPKVPRRLRFEAVAKLAESLAARHRLDFKGAVKSLAELSKQVPLLFDGENDRGLSTVVKRCMDLCVACSEDNASAAFLRELLDNTLRTTAQGRYEDAAARLYRCMEMQGQLWLDEATAGLVRNGRCKPGDVSKAPDALKALRFWQPEAEEGIKLSLEQIYLALDSLGHAEARKVATDIALQKKSRWRTATEKRNTSILAHGVQPIGCEGFTQMKQMAAEFLGFQMDQEANPIPALEARWLVPPE